MDRIYYNDWSFELRNKQQLFGKTIVIAEKDGIEEYLYIEEDFLTEAICKRLYEEYLYAYEF